jgi:outer membrane protein assembly factor BamB
MTMRSRFLWLLLFGIAGCSGSGSGGAGLPLLPRATASPGNAQGVFTIRIPQAARTTSKKPAYVSAATNSVSFQVAPDPPQIVPLNLGSSACPSSGGFYTCSANFDAPIGPNAMTIQTFASTNGTGTPLSMTTISITIVAGQVNPVNAVLNGVVATLSLALMPNGVVSGTSSGVQATWGGMDASNEVIVGPGSLVDSNGIAIAPSLSSSDQTDFSISPQSGASPAAWTIAYDGSAAASSPTITLRASGFTSVTAILTVNPAATPAPSTLADWDSFGYDLERTGYNPSETTVGVNNVNSLQTLWSFNVGATMVREPVYASAVTIKGQATNVLYAGSNFGATLYAINADTGAIIWSKAVPSAPYSCGTSSSQFAIAGTPAIDRAKNRIYFGDGHNALHALDLSTGAEDTGWPITIADYTPDHNFMHGGLAYNPANGMLYVVTGSTCDISPWYGRIDAINTSSASIVGTFYPVSASSTQGGSGGGVWGPGGPSIDPATNDVFIATGNADASTGESQSAGDAEQVVELSPDVNSVLAHNYPTNIPTIAVDDDFDFGATPLLFQPPGCPPLLAAVNKSGMFELYDRASIAAGPVQFIQMAISTDAGSFVGTPAYDPVTNDVYVGLPSTQGIYQPGLGAFHLQSNCTLEPTPAWSAPFGPDGATTSNQTPRSPVTIANGVVYVSNYTGVTEFAFNAANGALLWNVGLSGDGVPGTIVVNGHVYVSASDGTITAWALPSGSTAQRRRAVPHGQ